MLAINFIAKPFITRSRRTHGGEDVLKQQIFHSLTSRSEAIRALLYEPSLGLIKAFESSWIGLKNASSSDEIFITERLFVCRIDDEWWSLRWALKSCWMCRRVIETSISNKSRGVSLAFFPDTKKRNSSHHRTTQFSDGFLRYLPLFLKHRALLVWESELGCCSSSVRA